MYHNHPDLCIGHYNLFPDILRCDHFPDVLTETIISALPSNKV